MTIPVLKSIAKKYYQSVKDEFGDLDTVKNNIGDGWGIYVGENEPIDGFQEYYEGLNEKQIEDLHIKIRDRVIQYARAFLKKDIKSKNDKEQPAKKNVEPKKDTKLQIVFRTKKQKETIKNPTNEKIRESIKKQYPNYSGYDEISLIKLVIDAMDKGKVGNIEILEKNNAGRDLQIQQNIVGTSDYGKRIILKKEDTKDKKDIISVFKDIIIGFKEILEEVSPEDRNKQEIKSIKNVLDKLNKGSMSFTKPQKTLIKRAIDAYLDMDFVGDPQLQTEVNIAKKLKAKYKSKNDKEQPAKKKAEPIVFGPIVSQYVARIFANAMEEIMGEKEELKNKQFYFDLQSSQFEGDKLLKFLKSKSKSNEKKRNKIIQSLEWWAKFVGPTFKKKTDIFAIADVDDDGKHPLGLKYNKYDMGAVGSKDLIAIGKLVETFTPYKMVNKYGGIDEAKQFEAQKFIL